MEGWERWLVPPCLAAAGHNVDRWLSITTSCDFLQINADSGVFIDKSTGEQQDGD